MPHTQALIGASQRFRVVEALPTGYYVNPIEGKQESVFLPNDNATQALNTDDTITAIALVNARGELEADTRVPRCPFKQPILLTALDSTRSGAFFDFGMSRDLFVPKHLQESPIEPNIQYVVYPFVDKESGKLVGATKLRKFYPESCPWMKSGDFVEALVFAQTDLGYKVLCDEKALGLMFKSDIGVRAKIGDRLQAQIKNVRDDGKIDVVLRGHSQAARDDLQQKILDDLEAHEGISTLTDKSPPDMIHQHFQVSKGAYKRAIGSLFKQKLIEIHSDHIKRTSKKQ